MKSLKNPFESPKKRSKDDAKLVGELLGEEEEREMREALGEGVKEVVEEGDIGLTDEQKARIKEVEEEVSPEDRREEFINWADSIGKDEDWVDKTFTFNDDGSVEVEGNLNLSWLESAEGIPLLKSVGGYVDLSGLTSAKGLTLPESVAGHLDLRGLTSAEGLTLPESVGGFLDLGGLTSAKGLTLPTSVAGDLALESLTSAEGLTLPASVGGDLDLWNLTSTEGLTLPESVGGSVYLRILTLANTIRPIDYLLSSIFMTNLFLKCFNPRLLLITQFNLFFLNNISLTLPQSSSHICLLLLPQKLTN